jgi:hypothetical protein
MKHREVKRPAYSNGDTSFYSILHCNDMESVATCLLNWLHPSPLPSLQDPGLQSSRKRETAERAGRVRAGCLNAISGTAVEKSIDKHTPSVAAAASDAAPRGNIC